MTTFLEIQQRVATDFLNRTDLTSQIKTAIKATIRTHQRQRFWFLETATALACVVSVETIALPLNFFKLQQIDVTQNSADIKLVPTDFGEIRWLNINKTTGLPTKYCLYGGNIHLANIPDSAYPVPCYYLKVLPTLSADADTNKWLSAAEDLVVYGAAKHVWMNTLRNISAAANCLQLENQMLKELQREETNRGINRVRATQF